MAPQRPEFYVVDDASNFTSTNAKTQKDVLYFERDTGRYKLGSGDRWNDTSYVSPGVDVRIDQKIQEFLDFEIANVANRLNFEPLIESKGTAFNCDFGNTADSVARGKHGHSVKDINDLVLPEGIKYPETIKGYVLHDNKEFGPIKTENMPASKSQLPISAGWAFEHEKANSHLTPDQVQQLHSPVSVEGPGLRIEGQKIILKVGSGKNEVSPGEHAHREYADKGHTHTNAIEPSRLPAISREQQGAVPPAGSPSGRSLHDDGTWKYSTAMSIVQLTKELPFWVAPTDGILVFAAVTSQDMSTVDIAVNGSQVHRVATSKSKLHGFFDGTLDINVPFKKGDVFDATIIAVSNVQLGITLTR